MEGEDAMITRVSYIPFEIGVDVNFEKLINKEIGGLLYCPLNDLENNIFDSDIIKFENKSFSLYINEIGFCELIYKKKERQNSFTYEDVLDLLENRSNFKSSILKKQHKLCTYIDNIRKQILGILGTKRIRDDIFDGISYLSSYFYIEEDFDTLITSEENKRAFLTLLEPSIIQEIMTAPICKPYDDYISKMKSFDIDKKWNELTDIGFENHENIYMQFNGGVVFTKGNNNEEFVKTLMVKEDIFWFMAAYSETWGVYNFNKKLDLDKIEFIELSISKILLRSEKLLSYSMNVEHQKFFNKLVGIYLLPTQIEQAQKTLNLLKAQQRFLKSRNERKARTFIEYILLLLGFTQLVPLLFRIPLINLNFNTANEIIVLCVLVLIYLLVRKGN